MYTCRLGMIPSAGAFYMSSRPPRLAGGSTLIPMLQRCRLLWLPQIHIVYQKDGLGHHMPLTQWGHNNVAAILQTTFQNTFSWMKIFESLIWFYWVYSWVFNWGQVIIISGNGLVPNGTKPLTEIMMTKILELIWCHQSQWVDLIFWSYYPSM